MIQTIDDATKVMDAAPDIRPLRVGSDLPELVLSAPGTSCGFELRGHERRANLPVGSWLEIQFGEYTLDGWHAIEWRGEPRMYLTTRGATLLRAAQPGGPWIICGLELRMNEGWQTLRSQLFAKNPAPLSINASHLSHELLGMLQARCPTALRLEHADGLQNIGELRTLRFLNIEGLPVADLSALAPLRHLAVLDASYCTALRDLSALRELKALKVLDLSYCEFLEDLSALYGLNRLSALSLNGCVWLNDLHWLMPLRNLHLLSVYGCNNISNSQLDHLQAELPDCVIVRGSADALGIDEQVRIGTMRIDVPEPFIGDGI